MAKNIIMGELGRRVPNVAMAVTSPTTTTLVPVSGAPCAAGRIPGVAEANVDPVTGLTVLNHDCVAEHPVVGVNGAGNVAVSAGDLLYLTAAGVINKVTTGTPYGTAFGAAQGANTLNPTRSGQLVASGATTTIQVWVGKIN